MSRVKPIQRPKTITDARNTRGGRCPGMLVPMGDAAIDGRMEIDHVETGNDNQPHFHEKFCVVDIGDRVREEH
jgi:hypothetical protein